MPFREYNCQGSTAVRRIAYNKHRNELIVEFHPSPTASDDLQRIYHYSNLTGISRQEVEGILLNQQSLGEFINIRIKPNSQVQQIASFPPNLQSARPNYSKEWKECLEMSNIDREYLERMLAILTQCHPKNPPTIPPPDFQNSNFASHAEMKEDHREHSHPSTNPYAELDSDSEEDEQNELESNSLPLQNAPVLTIQSRYLFGRVICRIAEIVRNQAILAQRNKNYRESSVCWSHSYHQLFTFMNSHVMYWAAGFYQTVSENISTLDEFNLNEYYSNPNNTTLVFDTHHIEQLYELLNGYEILLADTERQKISSLHYYLQRVQFLNSKLYPARKERDEVKERIGNDRWTNNPDPKLDFAARRRKWEEDLANINEAIRILEGLDFVALKTRRH
jgi:hypothetical protein